MEITNTDDKADLAHSIKTPLNAILGAVENLKAKEDNALLPYNNLLSVIYNNTLKLNTHLSRPIDFWDRLYLPVSSIMNFNCRET